MIMYSVLEMSFFGCLHVSKYLGYKWKNGVSHGDFYAEGSNHPDVSKYSCVHCYLDKHFGEIEIFIFNEMTLLWVHTALSVHATSQQTSCL